MAFLEKLRLNSLYPSIPDNSGRDKTFDRFMTSVAPQLRREKERDITTNRIIQNEQLNRIAGEALKAKSAERPNIVFQKPASDIIPLQSLGAVRPPGSMTDYQRGQLGIKDEALDVQRERIGATAFNQQGQLAVRNRMADIAEFKVKNPGMKIIAPKGGNIQGVNPVTGQVIAEFGPSGTMTDEERMAATAANAENLESQRQSGRETLAGIAQKGRESLADIQARHAKELAEARAASEPTGSVKTEELIKDAEGNVTGRKTETKDVIPQKKPVMMYGPQGQGPYPIPPDKVEDAKKNRQMTTTPPAGK